jgi:hypothetical protein
MQIDGKMYWKSSHEYDVGIFLMKRHIFPCFFIWGWIKHVFVWNCPSDNYDLWNLKLTYLKPTLMNHCHENYFKIPNYLLYSIVEIF